MLVRALPERGLRRASQGQRDRPPDRQALLGPPRGRRDRQQPEPERGLREPVQTDQLLLGPVLVQRVQVRAPPGRTDRQLLEQAPARASRGQLPERERRDRPQREQGLEQELLAQEREQRGPEQTDHPQPEQVLAPVWPGRQEPERRDRLLQEPARASGPERAWPEQREPGQTDHPLPVQEPASAPERAWEQVQVWPERGQTGHPQQAPELEPASARGPEQPGRPSAWPEQERERMDRPPPAWPDLPAWPDQRA